MKKGYSDFKKRLQELKDNFMKHSSVNEKIILGEGFYKNPKDQILLEEYRNMKLEVFQDLLLELNLMFGRYNWMDVASGTFDPDDPEME
jgi:hypothetical protein